MTYTEAFATEQFKIFFDEELKLIETRHDQIRREAGDKFTRFKASPYSRVKENGHLNVDWMCNQFLLIQEKKALISADDRQWVDGFVRRVTWRTVMFYDKLEKEKPIELTLAPKVKKPRKKKQDGNK